MVVSSSPASEEGMGRNRHSHQDLRGTIKMRLEPSRCAAGGFFLAVRAGLRYFYKTQQAQWAQWATGLILLGLRRTCSWTWCLAASDRSLVRCMCSTWVYDVAGCLSLTLPPLQCFSHTDGQPKTRRITSTKRRHGRGS